MAVTLSATFTKESKEYNGLEAIQQSLIDNPLDRRVVVALVEVTNIDEDILHGGVETPRVRVVHMEAMTADAAMDARKLLDETFHERTGHTAAPPTLFDSTSEGEEARDPAAGPWPGDAGYVEPDDGSAEEPPAKGKRK